MKIFLALILFIFSRAFAQTTPLTFTAIASSPDLIANGRGAEGWNGRIWDNGVGGAIRVPAGNVQRKNDYYRFLWGADIEKTTIGVYDWTAFDAQINLAIDSGRIFSFGIMPMCSACGYTDHGVSGLTYPNYLHVLMQAESTNSKDWQVPSGAAAGLWVPNWNSPNYLARYKALLVATAAHIAGGSHGGKNYKDVIGYVDIRGFGDFGEWHNYPYYTLQPTGRTATAASLDTLINYNLQAFPNYPNVNLQGVFDPSNASQTPLSTTTYALTVRNAWGLLGWRRDNWGDPGNNVILDQNPNGSPTTDSIMNRYKYAPIVGEPNLSASFFSCGSILCDLPTEVTFYHATSFGNGNYASDGDAACQANVIQASRNSGYRLAPTGGSMTTNLYRFSTFNISLTWQNSGVAPTYDNYKVVYTLKNSGGTTVLSDTSTFNPKLFIGTNTISDNFNVGNAATGSGMSVYVSVIDPTGIRVPLQLAITGRQSDGSYLVRSGISIATRNTLVVLLGESNAAGLADNANALASELLSRPTVQILNHNTNQFENLHIGVNNQQGTFADTPAIQHGMELGLANQVDSLHLPNPMYLVKIGVSGQVICQDFPGGCIKQGDNTVFDAWTGYMPLVDSAIKRMNALGTPYDVVIWGSLGLNNRYNQGTPAAHFYDSMKLYIANIRNRIGFPTAAFYWTNFYNPPQQTYDWKYLFDSLAKTDANVHSVSVLGATYKDNVGTHWDYSGMKLVATNITDSMIALQSPPAPSASAGVDQTITLPTNSITLDGSLSINATSYLWTQVSGPSTATLANANTVSATASNLIAGTYVFQVAINGGSSVDQMSAVVNAAFSGSTTIFTTQTPVSAGGNDGQGGIETGVKFRSTVAGYVTGVRFYKTASNTGSHTGELYTSTGTRLGQAVFSGETASGWQTASFAFPIAISANTTYIISYFSSLGNYVADGFYFAGNSVTNGPLTALQDGTDGVNGVFLYTGAPAFPTNSYHSGNYWVDLVFSSKVVVGTGSGPVSVTSMAGLNPGDTIFIATQTGVYTSLTLKNLTNITVRAQSGRPTFTTTSFLCNNKGLNLGYMNFVGTGTRGLDMTCGPEYGDSLHHLFFSGWTGSTIAAFENLRYVYGDTTTYMWYKMTLDSIKETNCAVLLQGSFGTPGDPAGAPDVFRQLNVSRIEDIATQATAGEGTGIRGICFHCTGHDVKVTSVTQRGASGDVAWFYGSGWWHIWNVYKSGGPGRIARISVMSERSDVGDNWLYNTAKFNGTEYGFCDYYFIASDSVAGKFFGTSAYIYNNTMGHQFNDNFGYWSPMADNGQIPPGQHWFFKNNLGFDIGENNNNAGKAKLAVNNGGWTTIGSDTSNNHYYTFATQGALDSVTTLFSNTLGNFPKFSPSALTPATILHAGVSSPVGTVDFVNFPYRVPPDLGYLQFQGVGNGCGCIPGRRSAKKTIRLQ